MSCRHCAEPCEGEECAECRQFASTRELLGGWAAEEPPLGLAERTMRKVKETPQEFWIDRWIRSFSDWLLGRHPLAAAAMGGLLLLLIVAPNFLRSRAQGQLTGCETNLRTLSLALDDYARSHQGHYPTTLSEVPLQSRPLCPSTGTFTYRIETSSDQRQYTLICSGQHHGRENFPQWSSTLKGPVEP